MSNGSDLIGHDDSDEVLPAACARVACPPCCVSEIGGFLGYKLNGHHIVARQVFEGHCDQEPTLGIRPTRALLHCSTCGAFTQQKAICLRRQCKGKTAPGLSVQRAQLRRGRFPQSGSELCVGEPVPPSEEQRAFLDTLLAPNDQDASDEAAWREQGVTNVLTAVDVLAAYGLDLESLAGEVDRVIQRELDDGEECGRQEPFADDE